MGYCIYILFGIFLFSSFDFFPLSLFFFLSLWARPLLLQHSPVFRLVSTGLSSVSRTACPLWTARDLSKRRPAPGRPMMLWCLFSIGQPPADHLDTRTILAPEGDSVVGTENCLPSSNAAHSCC